MTPEELVRHHTRPTHPDLCPEQRLHLNTSDQPLWRADESAAASAGVPHPFWGFAWPGGQALARYLLDTPHEATARHVLDFGAGCGIGAIAAAMAGAASVTAAEIDPVATAAIGLNADLNEVTVHTLTRDLTGTPSCWDLVLAGDMFYDLAEGTRTGGWLRDIATHGTRVLIGDPGRGFLDLDGVTPVATYGARADNDPDGSQRVATTVWLLEG